MLERQDILLIAGQQQNVGKTTLACQIISHFSRFRELIALKVSPHFHKSLGNAQPIIEGDGFQVLEEKTKDGKKDTARMLSSGTSRAILIQSKPISLAMAFENTISILPKDVPLIVESAGLRNIIKPGIFLFLRNKDAKRLNQEDQNLCNLADKIVTFDDSDFDLSIEEINLEGSHWKFQGRTDQYH